MNQKEIYKNDLLVLPKWESYLLQNSGLPGPRANLTLLYVAAELGNEEIFRSFLDFQVEDDHHGDSPDEFIVMCGVVGLGKLLAQGKEEYWVQLKRYASDSRWRIRESVAMALQIYGEYNMERLLSEMAIWSVERLLEQRAAVAAICEPKLLKDARYGEKLFIILNQTTSSLLIEDNRKEDGFLVLKKALAYCWSVAIAAYPDQGKNAFQPWLNYENKDIRWVLKENLTKNRLQKLDSIWVERCKDKIGVK
ncbi:hypothetical protein [Paenibacillus sp. FSL K6-2524]|uniref:hypothetical protein n=1 Tax=Paenibacillus sp. FSL K6-2524 TaxID=2954516 RepID=UPI0030F9341F